MFLVNCYQNIGLEKTYCPEFQMSKQWNLSCFDLVKEVEMPDSHYSLVLIPGWLPEYRIKAWLLCYFIYLVRTMLMLPTPN